MDRFDAYARFAWGFLAYLLFVILFGAWVRVTHSGAGCGSHWPTCHGEIIPPAPSVETMIEYTHRLTSGLLGILGIALLVWTWRRFGIGRIFWAALVTFAFIIFEALIGAGIVLQELVTDDDSVARAIVIALHLANTLFLTGAAALTAWWGSRPALEERSRWTEFGALKWLALLGLVALVATSMTGAVTALGDTLFPIDPTLTDSAASGLFARVRDDLSAANHFLVRLRIVHPIVAVVSSIYLVALASVVRIRDPRPTTVRWSFALLFGVLAQIGVGLLNVGLSAPGWLQLGHLLVAQLVWIAAVLMITSFLSAPAHGET